MNNQVKLGRTRIGLSKGPDGIFRHYDVTVDLSEVTEDQRDRLAAEMVKTKFRNQWALENKSMRDDPCWPIDDEDVPYDEKNPPKLTIPGMMYAEEGRRGRKPQTPQQIIGKLNDQQKADLLKMLQDLTK